MLETIKEYLVSLGFSVDKQSYDQTTKAVDELGGGISELASNAVKMFGKAAAAVTSFGVAMVASTAKFLGGLGDQEIQMEMLSRQLWTTQQQAQAFNATLKAMGTNLQSLYLSPTLMQQYNELHSVALEMQTPGDYTQQIKQIQDIQLQLKQMRLEAYYALQWIGYYFIKYMQGPISNVENVLQSINDVIVKNMPTWTKKVAEVMASFMQAGIYIVQALGQVWNWLKKLLSYLPGWAKGVAIALAVISVSNPFMLFMEAIGAAILLLDDFETYLKDPTKSALPNLWSWVIKVANGIKQFSDLRTVVIGLAGSFAAFKILQTVIKWIKAARSAFLTFGLALDANPIGIVIVAIAALVAGLVLFDQKSKSAQSAIQTLGKAFKDVWSAVKNLISAIGDLFGQMTNSKNTNGMQNFFTLLSDLAIGAIKIVAGAIEEVAGLVNIVSDALHGDWKAAGQVIQNMWTGQNLANAGVIPQSWVAGAMGPAVGPPSYPYMFQGSSTSSTKNVNINAPVTNNISGSSPQATATAINNQHNMYMHTLKSVVQ
ncbi:hypothetical protein ACOALA_13460 [Alicyclobacillus acidoterrestris]|uniref:hypothetical protein n=1 Tax=Alicyclobacillus acidoterrestris TaxID=1450 RepID=UPI003F53615E